jgi:hypothetical protein
LTGFGVFLMFCPRPLRKQRAAILNRQPAGRLPPAKVALKAIHSAIWKLAITNRSIC